MLAFFAVLEIGLLSIGVEPLLAQKDPYVGFASQVPLFEEKTVNGQTVMETADNKLRWFNKQSFPKSKSDDTFRIFSLGGSTTYGRPYNDLTSFSGWLREMLLEAGPPKEWEVINAGGISYASYRIVRVMEELSQFDPNLFIVYTGHNEFLEERTYRDVKRLPTVIRSMGSIFGRTRTYAIVNQIAHGEENEKKPETDSGRSSTLEEEVKTRLDGGVGPDAYQRDEELATRILDHFRFNLERMIQIAGSCNAKILFVTPASNLANSSPFKSEHAEAEGKSEWQKLYDQADQQFRATSYVAAKASIEKAVELSPRHAHTHYLHGRILQKLGENAAAKNAFLRARDEDVCPLRALTRTVEIVREVAAKHQVPLVDFEVLISERSENNLPGESFFLDHVHPTIEGHRLLALELVGQLVRDQHLTKPTDWPERLEKATKKVKGRIDQNAHGEALRNLAKVLNWAGKKEEANQLALKASALIGDAETEYLAGNALLQARKIDDAIAKYRRALQIDPNHLLALNSLATAYFQSGRLREAEGNFQRVIQLKPDFAPAHNNLGSVYQHQGQIPLAMKHYREAVRLNPKYSKAYNNIGSVLRSQRKWLEAEKHFRKAIEIDSKLVIAHYNLGTVLEATQQNEAAMLCFDNVLRINPRHARAHLRKAIQFEKQGNWREAVRVYQIGNKCPSPPINIGRRLAWLLATCPDDSIRNGEQAKRIAQACVRATKERDPQSLSVLAAAYAATGNFAEAKKIQMQAVGISSPQLRPEQEARLKMLQQGKSFVGQ